MQKFKVKILDRKTINVERIKFLVLTVPGMLNMKSCLFKEKDMQPVFHREAANLPRRSLHHLLDQAIPRFKKQN